MNPDDPEFFNVASTHVGTGVKTTPVQHRGTKHTVTSKSYKRQSQ
jgi:hypothetical protein